LAIYETPEENKSVAEWREVWEVRVCLLFWGDRASLRVFEYPFKWSRAIQTFGWSKIREL